MHPKTLALVAKLFSLAGDTPFIVTNPHLGETKAMMCARLPASARGAVEASRSCDLAAASRGSERCGRCSSCLLRSIALTAAGRSGWDVATQAPSNSRASCLRPMLGQAATFERAVASGDPWAALLAAFPDLANLPHRTLSPSGVVELYRRHVTEVQGYPHPLVRHFLAAPRLAA